MTMRLALLVSTLLLGCASSPVPSNAEFLTRCWGAVAKEGGEYELSFEAISFFGLTEGGIYAQSASCPNARIRFSLMSPEIVERFRQEEERGGREFGEAGLRGRARIVPLERVHEDYIRVRVTRLLSLERMSDEETDAFMERHHIS